MHRSRRRPFRLSRREMLKGLIGTIIASQTSMPLFPSQALGAPSPPEPSEHDLVNLVNVLQGTDSNWGFSRGNTLPLVSLPFGMTNWSPQNKVADGWFFDPNLHQIQGIRATHQPSPWMGDYGHFTVMAQAGEAALSPESRVSSYRPEDFQVGPDYLKVVCTRDGVLLEVSPTERCAIFRVTFPNTDGGRVIIDAHSQVAIDAASHTISGFSRLKGFGAPDNFACYFHAEFDHPYVKASPTQDGNSVEILTTLEGTGVGVVAEFGSATVVTRIGTSFISVDQARQNLKREIGNHSLSAVRAEAAKVWNETLGVVRVSGGTPVQRRTFYSCLYRAHLFPRMFYEHDAAGKPIYYSPFDGKRHEGVMYTDTGLWDGYHTIYPLLSLLQPERLGEMVQGFINAYEQGGWLPQWPHPGYHGTMGGTHSDVVLTEAILKDIPGFDRESALAAMWKNASVPPVNTSEGRGGLADYLSSGYLPVGSAGAVVSNSLDFAYDDACIALAAAHLGHKDKQHILEHRALNYRMLYDPVTGFMRAKHTDGTWQEGFDEFAWGDAYTEGGPWQWSMSVPHDPAGLMTLMGGQAAFVQKLDRMLWQPPFFHVGGYGHEIHEMTEMGAVQFGQYSQGNQPVHQFLAHYIAAGCPSRFQYWSRRVLDHLYTPDSYPGDEDNGEMAAWYVLGAIGLFPHCPGRASYVFGSPLFPEVTISPPHGKPLTIYASADAQEAVYVNGVKFNGHSQDRLWISHQELMQGGRLEFAMGVRPIPHPLAIGDLPPSLSAYQGMPAETETAPIEISINCGGAAAGSYVGDRFVNGGTSIKLAGTASESHAQDELSTVGNTARQGTFTYQIPLPMPPGNGTYTMTIKFVSSMDVRINGMVNAGSGEQSLKEYYDVLPNPEGEVLIDFSPSPGSASSACGVRSIVIRSSSLAKETMKK